MKILLVDDDPQVRRAVKRQLQQRNYEIVEASDGSEAIRYFKKQILFDAVICDFDMPTSGKAVYEKYKEIFPDRSRRFVFHTAATDSPMLYGVRVFSKPSNMQFLLNFLESL